MVRGPAAAKLAACALLAAATPAAIPARRLKCLPLACAAAPALYNFTSAKTNTTYYLNTTYTDAFTGEAACQKLGGHLAIYTSKAEQLEVEAAFASTGGLIPLFHNVYWLGLRAQLWADFQWPDKSVPPPRGNDTYSAWAPGQPDNAGDGQLCTAGNYSAVLKTGAWGWSDEACYSQLVSICKVSSEWQVLRSCGR
jgi:hypothetical protein